MKDYYNQRAQSYDRIYDRPERQAGLAEIERLLLNWCSGRKVLDLGCGPGYWPEKISRVAHSITGIDYSPDVLSIAKARSYHCPVSFHDMSYYDLHQLDGVLDRQSPDGAQDHQHLDGVFDLAIGGFIASHIPLGKMGYFLKGVQAVLEPGSAVILFDNRFIEGNSTPISRVDMEGNSYQLRELEGKGNFEVMKNFPEEKDWNGWVPAGMNLEYNALDYFWILRLE